MVEDASDGAYLILSGLVLANIKIGLWRKAVRT